MMRIILSSQELSFPPRSPLEFEMEWRDLERDEEILINVFWTVKSPSSDGGAEGAERDIEDIALTRYACDLISLNGDPRKDLICSP